MPRGKPAVVVPSALGEATASGDAPSETLEPIVAAPPLDSVNAELPIAAVVQKGPSTLSGETNAHFVVAYRAGLPSAHSPNGKGPLLATTVVPPLGTSVPGGPRPSGSPRRRAPPTEVRTALQAARRSSL